MMNSPYGYSPRRGPTVDRSHVRRPAHRGVMNGHDSMPLSRSRDGGCASSPLEHSMHPRPNGSGIAPTGTTPGTTFTPPMTGRCGCGGTSPETERTTVHGCGCERNNRGGTQCGTQCGTRCSLCGGQNRERSRESGCGCEQAHGERGGCADGNCKRLMEQIRAVDFALYETILYLDVYPHSCDALETYHKLNAQRRELYSAYEAACGPITAFGNESTTSWDWTDQPSPWEYDAN